MPAFVSRIAPASDNFAQNRADMLSMVTQLRQLEQRAVAASEKRRDTFKARGQLTPHERLHQLLDPGMPFLRLFNMANYLLEDSNPDTSIPGGSAIIGIGFVSGVRCMIWVDDSGIRAGAATKGGWDAAKIAQLMARDMKLPFIHLVESAGANLMEYQVELWAHGGELFRNLAWLSAAGVPTLVVLHGPSTAGGAYMPGMSDYVVGVRGNGMAALGGAALVHAATGEVADDRDLGGSEMHASVSGSVEYLADDDAHGIAIIRDCVAALDWNRHCRPFRCNDYAPPRLPIDDLAGIVPADYTIPYDVREVVARIVDDSVFEDFKGRYGPATVCMQASIMGTRVGILGNNGPIDPDGAAKATHFLQLCDQSEIPLIFLHNTTGYMVGTASERRGMIKLGSKMIQAISTVRVPKIAFYIGASFGAGNYGMSGLAFRPDFLFSWPNARTGVMSGASAAGTMSHVARVRAQRSGAPADEDAIAQQEARIRAIFESQESAFYTSGRVLDHGVIDPRDTRRVAGFALETLREAKYRTLHPNNFGVARI
jgi:geranyl-CoA carboxylase beta subunit